MQLEQAWDSFHSGLDPDGVRPALLESWRRSRLSGVDPMGTEINTVDVPLDTPFTRAAVPPMLKAAELLGDSSICLTLSDPTGNIVWRWVSEHALTTAIDAGGMIETSHFGEEAVGTNGTGTALESRAVAAVVGAEHYAQSLWEWACIAAPVFHPITRRVCGAVNITCRAGDATPLMQLAIQTMADNVRLSIEVSAGSCERQLLESYLARRQKTLAPLVAINDKVVISDDAVVDHNQLWTTVRAADPKSTHVTLPGQRRARIWPVTAGTYADGAVLVLPDQWRQVSPDASHTLRPSRDQRADTSRLTPLEHGERSTIIDALRQFSGHRSRTAEYLGISRRALYDKLHRYRLT